jgi:long-chain acyl-CoA synthetase
MTFSSASVVARNSWSSLGQLFFRRVGELGCRTFLKIQRRGSFEDKSWRDFGAMVRSTLLSLNELGMAKGDNVAILGDNSLPWLCADLATLAGGLPNVVISPNVSDATLLKTLTHSRCRAIFIDGVAAHRLLALKGRLPHLLHAIVLNGAEELRGFISFAELLEHGRRCHLSQLDQLLEAVQPNDLATIMYTSGSAGEPKGVMRTHDNLLSNIASGGEIVLSKAEELTMIVLSLNHLFGRYGFLKSAVSGRTTAMIEATELNLHLSVIQALRPTAISVVPRVMERLWNAILDVGGHRQMWDRTEKLDRDDRLTDSSGCDAGTELEALKANLRHAARQALGGRVKYITYGGAAMPSPILRFFDMIGVPLVGSYGSTECGGVTLCGIGNAKPESLGKPFPNVELRLAEDGELLVRGPTVTPGYFQDPQATREAFDADGWFRTGDLGKLDNEGSLYIIGRKKDLFNCADGSNINPGTVEALLENDSFIRQAVLVGDHRPFIAALIVPDRRRIAAALDRMETDLSDGEVEAALCQRIELINTQLDRYEKIRKVAVIWNDFPKELRSTTTLQKIKIDRQAVEEMYRVEIEAIYSSGR